jgi:hypothetical protein
MRLEHPVAVILNAVALIADCVGNIIRALVCWWWPGNFWQDDDDGRGDPTGRGRGDHTGRGDHHRDIPGYHAGQGDRDFNFSFYHRPPDFIYFRDRPDRTRARGITEALPGTAPEGDHVTGRQKNYLAMLAAKLGQAPPTPKDRVAASILIDRFRKEVDAKNLWH